MDRQRSRECQLHQVGIGGLKHQLNYHTNKTMDVCTASSSDLMGEVLKY